MKSFSAVSVDLVMGLILGWGILLAVKGSWRFLIAGILAYLIAISRIGCQAGKSH
ncbi:MAG: hypothetical protein MUF81_00590 [Verrucomicrobia bacterium]|nr:hypothetical protein [Verrucomicrobiota bacterium]